MAQGIIFVIGIFGAEGTEKDVDNIVTTFEGLNFAVFVERDPTSEQIACLMRVVAECQYPHQYKYIAFYFAGHGGQDSSKKRYIKGVQLNESNSTILHIEEYIVNPLNSLKHCHRLFFFDCCQSSDNDTPYHPHSNDNDNRDPKVQPKVLIAFSTSPGLTSGGERKNGGLWTHNLCHNLKRNLPITDVLDIAREDVKREREGYQLPMTLCSNDFKEIVLLKEQQFQSNEC